MRGAGRGGRGRRGTRRCREALVLARLAGTVTVVSRGRLRAKPSLIDRSIRCANLTFVWDVVVERIVGTGAVEGVEIRSLGDGALRSIPCAGVFAYLGGVPNSDLLPVRVSDGLRATSSATGATAPACPMSMPSAPSATASAASSPRGLGEAADLVRADRDLAHDAVRVRDSTHAVSAQAGDARRSILVGVIGHVDHGKTALVRRLTGTETDRLQEEKTRGISIVLGFAVKQTRSGQIDLVDMPGHEQFVPRYDLGRHRNVGRAAGSRGHGRRQAADGGSIWRSRAWSACGAVSWC